MSGGGVSANYSSCVANCDKYLKLCKDNCDTKKSSPNYKNECEACDGYIGGTCKRKCKCTHKPDAKMGQSCTKTRSCEVGTGNETGYGKYTCEGYCGVSYFGYWDTSACVVNTCDPKQGKPCSISELVSFSGYSSCTCKYF